MCTAKKTQCRYHTEDFFKRTYLLYKKSKYKKTQYAYGSPLVKIQQKKVDLWPTTFIFCKPYHDVTFWNKLNIWLVPIIGKTLGEQIPAKNQSSSASKWHGCLHLPWRRRRKWRSWCWRSFMPFRRATNFVISVCVVNLVMADEGTTSYKLHSVQAFRGHGQSIWKTEHEQFHFRDKHDAKSFEVGTRTVWRAGGLCRLCAIGMI